jgi:transposase
MSIKGQNTDLAERIEIGNRWQSGQSDAQIAQELRRPISTIRKWRRRYQQQGQAGLVSPMGRPKGGPLSGFEGDVVAAIARMRQSHPGWGAVTIRIELEKDGQWQGKKLPSRSRIAAYIKAEGLARAYQPHQDLPEVKWRTLTHPHQEWEMDAQGAIAVPGLGKVAVLNVVDVFSHANVASLACLHKTHANTQDNQLVLRLAFSEFGLPEQISLDHDSVYYDNRCASPFPSQLHLWLLGLGIQVRFIEKPPPEEHAHIERFHQTLTRQALTTEPFRNIADFQKHLDRRRHFINWDYPCRSCHKQPPLLAFPQAQTTSRLYRMEWEAELFDLERIYAYLAQGHWFRSTTTVGTFRLGDLTYCTKKEYYHQNLKISFDPDTHELICLAMQCNQTFRLRVKGLTKEALMGELYWPASLPAYQMALPLSAKAWREMLLCGHPAGDTTI